MSLIPRYKPPKPYRDPRLSRLEEKLAGQAIPGSHSKRILTKVNNQIGRRERDSITRLQRKAAGNPLLVSEGIQDINQVTAQAASDSIINAELSEEQSINQANQQRARILMQQQSEENANRQAQAQADYQNQMAMHDLLVNLLGSAAAFAAGGIEAAALEDILAGYFEEDTVYQ